MANTLTLTAAQGQGKTPRRRRRRSDLKVALLFIAPALIGLVFFYIVPTARGLFLSFTKYSVIYVYLG